MESVDGKTWFMQENGCSSISQFSHFSELTKAILNIKKNKTFIKIFWEELNKHSKDVNARSYSSTKVKKKYKIFN